MSLFIEFKNLVYKKEVPDENLLVPIMTWLSGYEKNIEHIQRVNFKFFNGNRKIYIREVSLNNNVKHIIKYPKVTKDDEKTKFFYNDLATYFGWSSMELRKNINFLCIDDYKKIVAKAFGYDNKQRKLIGLEALSYDRRSKRIGTKNSERIKKTESQ